jgi:hypothetical protein
MNTDGISPSVPNVSLGLSTIGVADDGVVFGAGVTVGTAAFYIYGWQDDRANNPPAMVFAGDPAEGVQPGLRWGDNMAIRGAGANTQILLAPSSGTNVVLLRTASGQNFQTEVPPRVIAVSGVPSGFARFSVAFGPGDNTFWAKTSGGTLYLVEFDVNSGTASVLENYPAILMPTGVRAVGVDPSQKFMAGVMGESLGNNVRLYDISDLEVGPVMRDQETFATQNPTSIGAAAVSFGTNLLFALDENNGIKAFAINPDYVPPSVSIAAHPANVTAMEGATVTFNAVALGAEPLLLQWRFNDTNIVASANVSGANSNVLTLRNITLASAGSYSLFASNIFGTATTSNAVLTVVPTFNTAQMTNTWNLLPGDRPYLGTGNTERGLAYNSATANLLLVSRASQDPEVVVLDPATGAEKWVLNVGGIPASVAGVSLGLNLVGVGDDGAVFGSSVTVNSSTTPFYLYRWANDSVGVAPGTAFAGDPAASVEPGLRWGDALAVRGSGASTQVLLSPGSGTNVVLLRTTSGMDFQNEVAPAVISIRGVPSGFARLGLAFGPGGNTFWGKAPGGSLYLVEFDLSSNTGAVVHEYSTNSVAAGLRGISTGLNQRFLAGISLDLSHNVQLYEIGDLAAGPILRDQEVFASLNANVTSGGTGVTAFGGNYLFALDTNNGLKAFLIDPNYVPPITEFSITSVVQSGNSIILIWQSNAGQAYQVQSRDSLESGSWANLGSAVVAVGSSTSFTNAISGGSKFYRVVAH